MRAQQVFQMRLRQQHRSFRIFDHKCQAIARIRRVQRQVGAASFVNGQQRHHEFDTAFGAQGHWHIRTDAQPQQVISETVGTAVEFSVTDRGIAEHQCRRIRMLSHLGFDRLVYAQFLRKRGNRGIPVMQQALPFPGRHQLHRIHGRLGFGRHGFENMRQAVQQTFR